MALTLAPQPVQPRPLENRDGSIRTLARQMLTDLDRASVTTSVPTLTLEMLLQRLVEALGDFSLSAKKVTDGTVDSVINHATQVVAGAFTETGSQPELAYWRHRALQAEAGDDDSGF